MRKILSKEERKRKEKIKQLIIGGFLIVIMTLSVLGFALINTNKETKKEIEYKGIKFIQDNSGYWSSFIKGNQIFTKYNPLELQNISFFILYSIDNYANLPLYFVINTSDQEAVLELKRNMNNFVLRLQDACLPDYKCKEDLPLKNCSTDNIIVIEESEENTIIQKENCIFIKSSFRNQIRYADAFLYRILGL